MVPWQIAPEGFAEMLTDAGKFGFTVIVAEVAVPLHPFADGVIV